MSAALIAPQRATPLRTAGAGSRPAARRALVVSSALLKRYVIVRDIPGINEKSLGELGSISAASNAALAQAGQERVQWQHSYVVDGKTFCVYLAEDEAAIHEHAKIGGFPVSAIHEVTSVIDPTTAQHCPCAQPTNGAAKAAASA